MIASISFCCSLISFAFANEPSEYDKFLNHLNHLKTGETDQNLIEETPFLNPEVSFTISIENYPGPMFAETIYISEASNEDEYEEDYDFLKSWAPFWDESSIFNE